MGNYVDWDDPVLERMIEDHIRMIVASVRSYIVPDAILLRGSFGRGEGSVYTRNGKYIFLSDYEIDVVIRTPQYRKLFRQLSQDLTARLGVDTSLRWVRPDFLEKDRIGPFVTGSAPVTISLYESRAGSKTLWGDDLVRAGREIQPDEISPDSGIYLVLNRMAESLYLLNHSGERVNDGISEYYWVNKTILACGEALLLLWHKYNFSYRERGIRFAELAPEKLDFIPGNDAMLAEGFARATRYKLQPAPGLYIETVDETWAKTMPLVERVFQHLAQSVLGIPSEMDSEFPARLLNGLDSYGKPFTAAEKKLYKLLELYRAARAHSLPPALFSPHLAAQMVYAVIPLVFHNRFAPEASTLQAARQWLAKFGKLLPPANDPTEERDYLQKTAALCWKVFCYG